MRWVLALVAALPVAASAAPPPQQLIVRLCGEAESASHCERLLEAEQTKQFPGIAARDGRVLRLKTRAGTPPVELRDIGEPDEGADFRAYAFWDYWPQRKSAVVSVTTQSGDHYLAIDLDRGSQTRLPAEPLLAPDGQRFLVADLCEKQCGNLLQIWRFERDRVVRERTFKPAEKWYEADVTWRDATTLALDYSVAAPRRRLGDGTERDLLRAKPRLLRLADPEWIVDETGR